MARGSDDRAWLNTIYNDTTVGRDRLIRDDLPGTFESYARIFPPIELTHRRPAAQHRWSELALLCGVELTQETTWTEIKGAIATADDGALSSVGMDDIWSCACELSRRWRSIIGSILSDHDDSEEVFFGVWDGYGVVEESDFGRAQFFDLGVRCYFVWKSGYLDFGRFHAITDYGRVCPQDIAWPGSRSWFYHIDTDWTSGLIGGSRDLIADLLAASEVEIIEIDGDLSSEVIQDVPADP